MLKTARKPSADPVQEKLRADKSVLNKKVSLFIKNLIDYKKLLNGFPSGFFKQKSKITNEIPANPTEIINTLLHSFNEIASESNSIIQEQIDYSKNRRKKQPKKPNANVAPNTATQQPTNNLTQSNEIASNLEKQLAALEAYELVAEGSNPISRFITRIITPRIGFGEAARIRQLRMTLLDACAKTYKDLKRLHNEIAKSSSSSISNSYKLATSMWNHWMIVHKLFNAYRNARPEPAVETGGEIEVLPEEISTETKAKEEKQLNKRPSKEPPVIMGTFKAIMADIVNSKKLNITTEAAKNAILQVENELERLRVVPDAQRIDAFYTSNIEELYNTAIRLCNAEFHTNATSFAEMAAKQPPKIVEAQLRRWLGKARHQVLPGASSGSRLEIYREISKLKKKIDSIMDLLEAGLDEEKLGQAIAEANKEMISLRMLMRSLHFFNKPDEIAPLF